MSQLRQVTLSRAVAETTLLLKVCKLRNSCSSLVSFCEGSRMQSAFPGSDQARAGVDESALQRIEIHTKTLKEVLKLSSLQPRTDAVDV